MALNSIPRAKTEGKNFYKIRCLKCLMSWKSVYIITQITAIKQAGLSNIGTKKELLATSNTFYMQSNLLAIL